MNKLCVFTKFDSPFLYFYQVANPAFSLIYQSTTDTEDPFPGAYLFVVDGLLALAFAGAIWLWWDDIRRRRRSLESSDNGSSNSQL